MTWLRSLLSAIVVVLCFVAAPAHADTRTRGDVTVDQTGLPAAHDLRRVTWDYSPARLLVTAEVAQVSRTGVVLTARAAHDLEGYEVVARTRWRDGRKVKRLWIWFNTVQRTPVSCPGMRARWRTGTVRLSVPNTCLFDGATMRDFDVTTRRPGTRAVLDQISAPRRLGSSTD